MQAILRGTELRGDAMQMLAAAFAATASCMRVAPVETMERE